MIKSYIAKLFRTYLENPPHLFVAYTTIFFYGYLWIINPSNYIIVVSFIGLLWLYYLRFKQISLALLLTYCTSMVISTGKLYYIPLLPTGYFPKDIFPQGYGLKLIISPKHIVAALMLVHMIRDIVANKVKMPKLILIDISLICYFIWIIISDIFASNIPMLSLATSILSVDSLILYLFFRTYYQKLINARQLIFWLIIAVVFFESAISFQQLFHASPIYKSIEAQVDIEYYGNTVDEQLFTFRPVGTFSHANKFGITLAFFLSILLAGLFAFKSSRSIVLAIIIGFAALCATLSRSAWIGYLVSATIVVHNINKIHHINPPKYLTVYAIKFGAIGAILGILFLLPRLEKSLYAFENDGGGGYFRWLQTNESLALIQQHPIFGVGSGMSVLESIHMNPTGIFAYSPLIIHNWYLFIIEEHGTPAIIFYMIFVILSLQMIASDLQRQQLTRPDQFIRVGFFAGVIGLLLTQFFQPYDNVALLTLCFGLLIKSTPVQTT